MDKRTPSYIRGRPSRVLVEEMRGVYKIFSIVLGSFFTTVGLRDIFFCGQPLTSDPIEAQFLSPFRDCETDIYQKGFAGIVGTFLLLLAALRFHMCVVETTADLYKSMLALVAVDAMFIFLAVRPGLENIPMLYFGMVVLSFLYETYVLVLARRAYRVRLEMKKES